LTSIDPATAVFYPRSLHDALPIYRRALSFDQETAKKSPVRLELVRAVDLQKRAGPIIIRFLTITLKALANSSPRFAGIQKWLKEDRKSTRLNSSHQIISYAVICFK